MLDFDQISYLRWIRKLGSGSPPAVPFTFSGMSAPDAGGFEGLSPTDLLAWDGSDHIALARRMAAEWNLQDDQVILLPGSHWTLLLTLMVWLSRHPGPVVVEDPAYEPLWRIPEALGAEVLRWPRPRGSGFQLDPGALEALIARRPSALLFSHPHNPTGVALGEDDRNLIREFQEQTGALVISDEVYLEFEADPAEATLLGTCENLVAVRSFTKVMGLGPIRCSALAGAAGPVAAVARAADYGPSLLPSPTRVVAERAWEQRDRLWSRARQAARAGRAEVEAFSGRAADLLTMYLPASGIICFPQLLPAVSEAAVSVARRRGVTLDPSIFPGPGPGATTDPQGALWIEDLRRRQDIQLTPGEFFGDGRAFRLGFGIEPALVRRGLEGLETYMREIVEEA